MDQVGHVSGELCPRTTTALLDGLHDEKNRAFWEEFDQRYRSILQGFARHLGLDAADAADIAQDTLLRFVQEYRAGRYERGRGRLRTWLITIAKYRILDLRRARARKGATRGDSALIHVAVDDEATRIWEAEQRRFIYEQAVAEIRRTSRLSVRTIEAFERVVLRQEGIQDVAEQLGMTPQDIYDAKRRIAEKLRDVFPRFEALFADD